MKAKHEKKYCIKVSVTPEEHAEIADAALSEGVSINQFFVYRLACYMAMIPEDVTEGFEELFETQQATPEA